MPFEQRLNHSRRVLVHEALFLRALRARNVQHLAGSKGGEITQMWTFARRSRVPNSGGSFNQRSALDYSMPGMVVSLTRYSRGTDYGKCEPR